MPKPQRFLSAGELNVAHARLKDLFSAKSTHGGRAPTRQIMALIRDVEEFTTGDVVPSDALRMARAMLLLGHPQLALDRVESVLWQRTVGASRPGKRFLTVKRP